MEPRARDARKLSIDARTLEGLQALELADHETPEQAFERHFARAVVCQVLDRMAEEARSRDKAEQFAALRCYLEAEGGPAYADKAAVLGMGEGAVRVAVHRLRERFRELLLVEVRHTLADPDEAIDEIDQLLSALAGPETPERGRNEPPPARVRGAANHSISVRCCCRPVSRSSARPAASTTRARRPSRSWPPSSPTWSCSSCWASAAWGRCSGRGTAATPVTSP